MSKFILVCGFMLCSVFANAKVQQLPHKVAQVIAQDASIFTQGAVFSNEHLYLSGGKYGQSALYQYRWPDMQLVKKFPLPNNVFAEGIAIHQGDVLMLTWKNQALLRFASDTLAFKSQHSYQGEGWGLTKLNEVLYKSDGSANLTLWDANTLFPQGRLPVQEEGEALEKINELEQIDGLILANVWYQSDIVVICPANGQVVARINMQSQAKQHSHQGVLNGIAWWPEKRLLWASGKFWDKAYLLDVSFEQARAACPSTS